MYSGIERYYHLTGDEKEPDFYLEGSSQEYWSMCESMNQWHQLLKNTNVVKIKYRWENDKTNIIVSSNDCASRSGQTTEASVIHIYWV